MNKYLPLSVCFVLLTTSLFSQQVFNTGLLIEQKKTEEVDLYEFDDLGFGEKLPDSVSLRKYAPYPGNQGSYSTCVGWAYGYAATSILYAQKFNITDRKVITASAMCPFSVYNQIKESSDYSCRMGTYMHNGAKALTKTGTKRFYLNEIGCGEIPKKDTAYRVFKAYSYATLWDEFLLNDKINAVKIANTKKALAENKPVVIGFKTTVSFMYGVNKSTGLWNCTTSKYDYGTGGHAMTVIGYNDKKFGGAFEIQNSWGQDWGNGGYLWIKYEDFANFTYNAYVVQLKPETKSKTSDQASGCEFGNCKNGYSRFKFENGDVYEGTVRAGIPEGKGIYYWSNGEVYVGDFKNGKKEGDGDYYFSDGTIRKCYWLADTINKDYDILSYSFGTIDAYSGQFEGYYKSDDWIYGDYTVNSSRGASYSSVYTGKFKDNKKDGFGIRKFSNYLYVGQVKDDYYEGLYAYIDTKDEKVTLYSKNSSYSKITNAVSLAKTMKISTEAPGDTVANMDKTKCLYGDCLDGYGKYIYASGNTYEGYFTNGFRNGYGKYTLKEDGKETTIEGVFLANYKDGVCQIQMADGAVFIGEFQYNKPNGYGLFVSANTKMLAGKWESGEYVEWEDALGFGEKEDPEKLKAANLKIGEKNKHKPKTQNQTVLK